MVHETDKCRALVHCWWEHKMENALAVPRRVKHRSPHDPAIPLRTMCLRERGTGAHRIAHKRPSQHEPRYPKPGNDPMPISGRVDKPRDLSIRWCVTQPQEGTKYRCKWQQVNLGNVMLSREKPITEDTRCFHSCACSWGPCGECGVSATG